MQTSVPGHMTEGCSALLGCLAPAVSIQAGRVRTLYKCAWEWDTFSKTSESSLGTSLTGEEHSQHPKEGNLLDTSCEGWDASPVHGAVSALQDRLREVCPGSLSHREWC